MKIAFIGLGNMGMGMASNLLRWCQQEGHRLFVLDLKQDVVNKLVAKGAETETSVQKLVQQAQVLFTSLPSAKEIHQLAMGEQGILQNLPKGALWFETSTNELEQWEKIKAEAPSYLSLIDAPVTGGAEGATAGTLTMLLGIEQNILDKYTPMLTSFTNKALRMGPSGAGYIAKLCQLHLNYLVAQGIGETLMLGAKGELDLNRLYEVLQNSCAQSYVVDNYIPKVLDGSYDPSFSLGLARKDMRLITELGQHLNIDLMLAKRVYQTYQTAVEQFGENVPHLSLIKLIEEKSGQLLRS